MFCLEGMPATNHLPQPDIGALYSDHHGWLQGWLRCKLGNAVDAADLAQDTFIRVLSKHEAPDVLAPRAYLSTIARGLVADFFRRQDLERTYLDTLAALPEQHTPSSETRALILEALSAIDAILDGMKPAMRQAFLLSQLEGLTYPAIAERLGVSLRTVNTYMADAIAHCHRVAPGMDSVRAMMQAIPPHIGAPVLQAPLKGRRQALRGLALLASGGAIGYAVYGSVDDAAPWRAALAEYRTGVGAQRSVRLADGSLLILNTDSAVDVRFDAGQRTVPLRSGEIVIETAHRPHAGAPRDTRPFVVQTAHGAMRALGTRFTVRHAPESTTLVVLEHAVAVRHARASLQTPPVLVHAGPRHWARGTCGAPKWMYRARSTPTAPCAGAWWRRTSKATVLSITTRKRSRCCTGSWRRTWRQAPWCRPASTIPGPIRAACRSPASRCSTATAARPVFRARSTPLRAGAAASKIP